MLRVVVKEERGIATLQLEGVLAGPWVHEVERCWQETKVCPERVIVDLSGVRSLDGAGRELLEAMHAAGTHLRGAGLLVEYILEQIQQKQSA
jgi:anti-anti-sigma regulatory factor